METKTIEQWFNELPEPYRSQALENTLNQFGEKIGKKMLKIPAPNVGFALFAGFLWVDTPKEQGFDYWLNFYETL